MSELSELYQEIILDHNRTPRNFRKIEPADRTAEGYNPLCGDHVSVFLKLGEGGIEDIAFQGSGCAISKASASMMTEAVKGRTENAVEELFEGFHRMVTGHAEAGVLSPSMPGKLAAFSGVSEFPLRVKCATLPWHTLRAALAGQRETVSTE
jgi:nitrogen fixation protein NifU and related proteins